MGDNKFKEVDWRSKEQRELFCDIVGKYIVKSGSEKDPVLEKVMPLAQQVVDKAFQTYPDRFDTEEEKPL